MTAMRSLFVLGRVDRSRFLNRCVSGTSRAGPPREWLRCLTPPFEVDGVVVGGGKKLGVELRVRLAGMDTRGLGTMVPEGCSDTENEETVSGGVLGGDGSPGAGWSDDP